MSNYIYVVTYFDVNNNKIKSSTKIFEREKEALKFYQNNNGITIRKKDK